MRRVFESAVTLPHESELRKPHIVGALREACLEQRLEEPQPVEPDETERQRNPIIAAGTRKSGSAMVESGAPVSTLLPAAETICEAESEGAGTGDAREPTYDAASVFSRLKPLKPDDDAAGKE